MLSDEFNSEGLPILEFNWADNEVRTIAENIWHAQHASWPIILTYDWVSTRKEKDSRRKKGTRPVPQIETKDEYPFVCTVEHKGNPWVGHAPAAQNSAQGTMIHKFLSKHGAYDGACHPFRFEVRVTNYYPAVRAKER
jgi:hypothetical protein